MASANLNLNLNLNVEVHVIEVATQSSNIDKAFEEAIPGIIERAAELDSIDAEVAILRHRYKERRFLELCHTPSYRYKG